MVSFAIYRKDFVSIIYLAVWIQAVEEPTLPIIQCYLCSICYGWNSWLNQ